MIIVQKICKNTLIIKLLNDERGENFYKDLKSKIIEIINVHQNVIATIIDLKDISYHWGDWMMSLAQIGTKNISINNRIYFITNNESIKSVTSAVRFGIFLNYDEYGPMLSIQTEYPVFT